MRGAKSMDGDRRNFNLAKKISRENNLSVNLAMLEIIAKSKADSQTQKQKAEQLLWSPFAEEKVD